MNDSVGIYEVVRPSPLKGSNRRERKGIDSSVDLGDLFRSLHSGHCAAAGPLNKEPEESLHQHHVAL